MGDLPDIVHMPNCCGEFVVSRQRVRARPRSFYQNALDIMEVRAPSAVAMGPTSTSRAAPSHGTCSRRFSGALQTVLQWDTSP